MQIYFLTLIKSFFKKGKMALLDMAFNFCGIMAQVIVFINLFFFRIANFTVGNPLIEQDYLSWIFGILIQMIVPIITLIILKKKIRGLWKGILLFPLFIFSWLPINLICIFKQNIEC